MTKVNSRRAKRALSLVWGGGGGGMGEEIVLLNERNKMVFNYQHLRKGGFGEMAGALLSCPQHMKEMVLLSRGVDRKGPLTVPEMNFYSCLSTLIESEGCCWKP